MEDDADEILPGLWLGNCEAAQSAPFLKARNISHVASVIFRFHGLEVPTDVVKQKQFCLVDQPGEDLLGHLNDLFPFIEEGLTSGTGVLVHCAMGVSRSAAAVTAYIMYKEKCTLDAAMKKVLEKHPQSCPNEGFMEQLRLFEAMGCECNPSNTDFKQHRLQHVASEVSSGEKIPQEVLASDPEKMSRTDLAEEACYKCRKCRRALFRQSSVIPHSLGKGTSSFKWHRQCAKLQGQSLKDTGEGSNCTSVFIEPVKWMESYLVGEVEGKISCPKCNARLGSFNWSGHQCSCGMWVTPAFQVHLNSVDRIVT